MCKMSLSLGCHFGNPFVYVGCAQREPNGLKMCQAKNPSVSRAELLCLDHWSYRIGGKITQVLGPHELHFHQVAGLSHLALSDQQLPGNPVPWELLC